eukprot:1158859-Pelagomonas_calceolata.AAC.1
MRVHVQGGNGAGGSPGHSPAGAGRKSSHCSNGWDAFQNEPIGTYISNPGKSRDLARHPQACCCQESMLQGAAAHRHNPCPHGRATGGADLFLLTLTCELELLGC